MAMTRVLIVDDSAVIRRLLTEVLSADADIEVVGAVGNAELALARIRDLAPDVVTLDIEMPDVSGLDLLLDIRKLAPRLPVIMFSSLTQRAASTTLEALARGATDYVTKPAGTGSKEASIEQVREQLIPKIKALGIRNAKTRAALPASPAITPIKTASAANAVRSPGRIEIVAIGSSTGGPNALAEVFAQIPASFPLPIVIAQHMPPLFTQLLSERLTNNCPLTFREAKDGDALVPGVVYIAPGDYHMRVARDGDSARVHIDREAPENSCRPAVDVLFRSVAAHYGNRALAIVLTGMGQDGLRGCELLHAQGSQIIVQDEASSVVWGMPGFVARAGLAQRVLPLAEIAGEIIQRARRGATAHPTKTRTERHHAG